MGENRWAVAFRCVYLCVVCGQKKIFTTEYTEVHGGKTNVPAIPPPAAPTTVPLISPRPCPCRALPRCRRKCESSVRSKLSTDNESPPSVNCSAHPVW